VSSVNGPSGGDATSRPEPEFGVMITEFTTPSIPLLLDRAGFDFGLVDTEHGTVAPDAFRALLLVARLGGTRVLVRVPGIDRRAITEALDLGAAGIVVPHVDTVPQADAAARAARFAPEGARGMSTMKAHTLYDSTDVPGIVKRANASIRVYMQIESRAGVENAGLIARVPGVDGLLVGPSDLLQDLGYPGQFDHPDLADAVKRVAEAAVSAGIAGGAISSNTAFLEKCYQRGMGLFIVGSDLGHFLSGARASLAAVRAWRRRSL